MFRVGSKVLLFIILVFYLRSHCQTQVQPDVFLLGVLYLTFGAVVFLMIWCSGFPLLHAFSRILFCSVCGLVQFTGVSDKTAWKVNVISCIFVIMVLRDHVSNKWVAEFVVTEIWCIYLWGQNCSLLQSSNS